MTGDAFLRWIRSTTAQIRRLRDNRAALMSALYPGALRLHLAQVQESAPDDKLARLHADIDVLTARIETLTDELNLAKSYAAEVIDEITDRRHQKVLTLFYLTEYESTELVGRKNKKRVLMVNLSWIDVAMDMDVSVRTVHRLHREAVMEFNRLADALPDSLPN